MAKSKTQELCVNEDIENCFSESTSINTNTNSSPSTFFNFANTPAAPSNTKLNSKDNKLNSKPNNKNNNKAVKRSYMLKGSTIVKLNKLKYLHPDLNIWISSIVEAAIEHYYDYIVNQGGSQK